MVAVTPLLRLLARLCFCLDVCHEAEDQSQAIDEALLVYPLLAGVKQRSTNSPDAKRRYAK